MGRRGVLTLVLVAGVSTPAAAWEVLRAGSGAEVHWPAADLPLRWAVDGAGAAEITDGSDLAGVEAALDTWSAVACTSFGHLRDLAATGPAQSCLDGTPWVFWVEDTWPPELGSGTVAVTVPCYDPSTGALFDADVQLNGVDFTWATHGSPGAADVGAVATHELGHALGFGHSTDPAATMYYRTSLGDQSLATLAPDDEAAVCYLYPTDCLVDGDCASDEVCRDRRCQRPPPPPAGLGDACTTATSCETGTGDPAALCLSAGQGWPGGYCTILGCTADTDCPAGGACAVLGTDGSGNPVRGCADACLLSQPDCRPDYACLPLDLARDLGICAPACQTDADCTPLACDAFTGVCTSPGDATAATGDPCAADTDCATGSTCILGWPGGYCARRCGAGRGCPSAEVCVGVDVLAGDGRCLAACTDATDCLSGQACVSSLPGSPETCRPGCSADTDCPAGFVCEAQSRTCVPGAAPDGGAGEDAGNTLDGGAGGGGGGDAGTDGGASDGGPDGPKPGCGCAGAPGDLTITLWLLLIPLFRRMAP